MSRPQADGNSVPRVIFLGLAETGESADSYTYVSTNWAARGIQSPDLPRKSGPPGNCRQVALPRTPRYGEHMREDIDRLLTYLGRLTARVPSLQMILGFLMANPGRVRFVASLDPEAELAMAIAAHRRIELPISPWQGYIRGVPVPDPVTWIQAARSVGGDIHIRLSSDDPLVVQLLNPVIAPDQERRERRAIESRMQNLRQELDRTLDLYSEVRHLMEIDHERHQELEQFLTMAETEMQNMGRELSHLKERIDENPS